MIGVQARQNHRGHLSHLHYKTVFYPFCGLVTLEAISLLNSKALYGPLWLYGAPSVTGALYGCIYGVRRAESKASDRYRLSSDWAGYTVSFAHP